MTVKRVLIGWLIATALLCVVVYQHVHVARAPMPSAQAQRWAITALHSACTGAPVPEPPAEALRYRAPAIIALAWSKGRVQARHVGGSELVTTVRAAIATFEAASELRVHADCRPGERADVRFTLAIDRGRGALVRSIPLLSNLSVVPMIEGLRAELDGKVAYVTPDELTARGLFDHVPTGIPDLSLGLDLRTAFAMLAEQLRVPRARLEREATIERFVSGGVLAHAYPASVAVTRESIERAARDGAEFLLRHQEPDGRYTYVYDGASGQSTEAASYNLPRHAGTTYFLAQADRVLGMPEAREGALRALRWIARSRLTRCGARDRLCVTDKPTADMGSAALTAVAAAEVLRGGDDPTARMLLLGLTNFIRSMQRQDGELMHIYDLRADAPIDIQRMYYSGEAAYALLRSHEILDDPRNLEAARRLMGHLTGAGWSFFGSRYFYGEEHWTCQAVAQAGLLLELKDIEQGLDFCMRWLGYQRELQYRANETPWPVAGAIGVGPVILPRLTTVSSRTETGAMLYPVVRKAGLDAPAIAAQVHASLGFLMRMRWAPGPAHLMMDPAAAYGGIPGSPASLDVRNDFVQHAGTAMLLWAEVLREHPDAAPSSH